MVGPNVGSNIAIQDPEASQNPLWIGENGYYQLYDYWMSLCGLYELYDYALKQLGDIKGQRILDCGCGRGHASVMLNKLGACVTGFDISVNNLKIGRALAKANDVSVGFVSSLFEEQSFRDQCFDLLFGSCILHHVGIAKAAQEMSRILRPGGKGIFIENSNRNPVLMAARKYICGSFGIAKYGDDNEEHPLTRPEIETLNDNFDGQVRVSFPSLVFFRLSDFYIFKKRTPLITNLLRSLDKCLSDHLPLSKRYSYFQVIQLEKN